MALSQIQLLYQVSPIVLTGGIASNISGGMLPLLSLTNPNAFSNNMLSGNPNFELDDAFGVFQPSAGGSLIEEIVAAYPYANLNVAANAIIRNPINLSMIMLTPMKQISSWSVKQQIMTSLKNTLDTHNNSGGTYIVFTPAYVYTDMLMVNLVDCSVPQSPIPQNAWRWDFTKPLVSETDTKNAMNNLMNQINNGTAPTGGGDPTTTGPRTTIGQSSSIINTGPNANISSPGISQNVFPPPNPVLITSPGSGAGDILSEQPGSSLSNFVPTNDPFGFPLTVTP